MERSQADHIFEGTITFQGAVNHKTGSVLNQHIGANAADPIDAEKLEKEFCLVHSTDVDSAATSWDLVKHICQAAGEVVDVEIAIVTPPTGDYKVNVDVQKWNGSAWSSILDAAEDVDDTYTANTPQSITLSGTVTMADGNLLRILGVASGSSGAQGQGLIVQVRCREKP